LLSGDNIELEFDGSANIDVGANPLVHGLDEFDRFLSFAFE